MGNNEPHIPSKRVRIVLCAAVFAFAVAAPAGLAADWSSGMTKPSADWSSGKAKPTASWTSRVKPSASWTS